MSRPSLDQYFMRLAKVVSTRATCPRKLVGTVIVSDQGKVLSTGYNGSIAGTEHCIDTSCLIENNHCVRTIHAEMNALIQAAKNGSAIEGSTVYITASPCWNCFKALANAGVRRICYAEFYQDTRSLEIAKAIGLQMDLISEES